MGGGGGWIDLPLLVWMDPLSESDNMIMTEHDDNRLYDLLNLPKSYPEMIFFLSGFPTNFQFPQFLSAF